MDEQPDWLLRLRSAPAAHSGIHWLRDQEIAAARDDFDEDGERHLSLYDQIASYTDKDLRGDAAERLGRSEKVGEGVEGGRFVALSRVARSEVPYPAEFWFDPATPNTLFCSLNSHCPPHLWFPVGQTLDSIAAATSVYFNGRPADPAESPGQYAGRIRGRSAGREVPSDWTTTRVLLGVIGDVAEEENRFVRSPAFCRGFDSIATGSDENRMVPQLVFHTLQSFSRIRLEYHQWLHYDIGDGNTGSPLVAEIAYPACPHADLIRVYNEAMDTDVPDGVPVDVLGALFGYPMKGLPRLHRAIGMNTQPADVTYVLGLVVAAEGDYQVLQSRLRELSTHASPEVRATVAYYANVTRYQDLLREMLERENDPGVHNILQNILEPMADDAE